MIVNPLPVMEAPESGVEEQQSPTDNAPVPLPSASTVVPLSVIDEP
jgi:hypothetical protein